MKKILLFLAAVFSFSALAVAQSRLVTGTVVDTNGEPIVGAAVVVQGTTIGTATNVNGRFEIKAPEGGGDLQVYYIGYKTVIAPIGKQTDLTITLEEDATDIENVVIVAYGTATRASLTGAVAQVKADEIEKRPTSSVTSALEGTTTGVQVNNTFGEPGSEPTIRIRGFGSVNGSNSPLYVVDGVAFGGNISDLNPADIESISVLKDASSAALFGNRASNGVVLITTKQGRKDKLSVNVAVKQGFYQRGIAEYDRLDADPWMETMWRGAKNYAMSSALGYDEAAAIQYAHQNTMETYVKNNIYNKDGDKLFTDQGKLVPGAQILPGYDDLNWFDYVERVGHRQEYTVSADVAGDKFSAFMSMGYLGEKGYTLTSEFQRFTGRANLSYKPTNWLRVGVNLAASSQESDFMKSNSGSYYANAFYAARYMAPVYPVYQHGEDGAKLLDPNGKPLYNDAEYVNSRNTVYENLHNQDKSYRQTMSMQPFVTVSFLKDFQLSFKGDLNVRSQREHTFDNPNIGDGAGNNGRIGDDSYRYKNFTFQQQLTWGHKYGNHSVDVLLGHENYKNYYDYIEGHKSQQMLYGDNTQPDNFSSVTSFDGAAYEYTTESYLGRVRYNYDEKYFAEASFRRDGSSRFHPDHRWGNFWSVGGSWMISRENFMKDVRWINDLKLRAAYGEVGNDAGVGYYGYMSLYSADSNGNLGAYYKSQNEATNIKWETTATFDVALEGRLWNRVNFSFDYFDKRSRDLLFSVYLPNSAGATSTSTASSTITKNIGTVSNRGLEVAIDVDVINRRDWRWNIGANASIIKNKIIKLPNGEDIPNGNKMYSEGHSIYEFYYYQFAGVDQMTGNSLYKIADEYNIDFEENKATEASQAFDVVVNGQRYTRNTTYAKKDWSGSALPKVYGGLNTTLNWKNLTFSALFTYSIGGKMYDSPYASLMSVSTSSARAIHKDILKSWNGVPEGMTETSPNRIDPNGIPAVDMFLSQYNNSASTRWLTSNSYFSIKNLSLSYDLPRTIVSKIGLQGLSVNFTVENAALFTARKGMNPQYNFTGGMGDSFVTARVFSLGLNLKL